MVGIFLQLRSEMVKTLRVNDEDFVFAVVENAEMPFLYQGAVLIEGIRVAKAERFGADHGVLHTEGAQRNLNIALFTAHERFVHRSARFKATKSHAQMFARFAHKFVARFFLVETGHQSIHRIDVELLQVVGLIEQFTSAFDRCIGVCNLFFDVVSRERLFYGSKFCFVITRCHVECAAQNSRASRRAQNIGLERIEAAHAHAVQGSRVSHAVQKGVMSTQAVRLKRRNGVLRIVSINERIHRALALTFFEIVHHFLHGVFVRHFARRLNQRGFGKCFEFIAAFHIFERALGFFDLRFQLFGAREQIHGTFDIFNFGTGVEILDFAERPRADFAQRLNGLFDFGARHGRARL